MLMDMDVDVERVKAASDQLQDVLHHAKLE